MDYNVAQPDLSTDSPLWDDQGGSAIPVDGNGSTLVLHLHGADGKRDQVVDVPAP